MDRLRYKGGYMNTIALRFGEHLAPECGTIEAHRRIIDKYGYVWYGKMGNRISEAVSKEIVADEVQKILLIRSGHAERYWAIVKEISYDNDDIEAIPEYYRNERGKFKTWFKITKFVEAPKDIMSKCVVTSSGQLLGNVSKHSMSPYFKIEYKGDE